MRSSKMKRKIIITYSTVLQSYRPTVLNTFHAKDAKVSVGYAGHELTQIKGTG